MTANIGSKTIRVGVIGLGYGGETAIRCFQQVPGVEVVALAGLEEVQLAALGGMYSISHLYRSYHDLLAHENLDAISIAVPNYLHAPVAIAALERGLHVLCEKPVARTGLEAEQMVQAATRANRVLQVVFNHRERGDVQVLKSYIDKGELGTIYYTKLYWLRRRGIPGVGSWFSSKEKAGGGPLIDLGVHVLDIGLYLLGEPEVVSVSASTYHELGARGVGFDTNESKSGAGHDFEVEDLATAFMRLSTGVTLLLEACWASHGRAANDFGIVLYGTKGGAEIYAKDNRTTDALRIYTDVADVPAEITPQSPPGGFHQAVIHTFIQRIRDGHWSLYNGSDGLRRARIIDACYASAAEGREVILSPL
ncbi:Gfo/Idh/MocA family protein [Tengunoibacter tsumagoiensis]|uniref:Oxidoreductase n=1 Tax=Tengunoibacter tsumagoiensis TaxID=2014871 RepID=A0A402A8K0_9CHLR|nr:Gfo/Idh/MocA family oxidoreductase [Tengunoibacter tsumagoiensis]GCE15494.1 oxidoreductase [Tengunoibacter tsumagoiensis]